ncbi:sugar ABC transporter ATP-binding protein [Burkholderia multivorans]|nr:sugar ABC transporter ATP-binding protein [Burkholderia multivorans]MCO1341876.1 sugar ABC transporter ATP-binding protein [Burkholderia multivorans]MCO1441068.1 sugar ABC transporter ATP-binding protein [Burkholderia multivorans]UQO32128.1 sugar ABC transporter ATP-binding protein [Burkholderia multivorans]UQO45264.1 sugar ABC transporter ATP-binding protein [Burkholderia multivorans]
MGRDGAEGDSGRREGRRPRQREGLQLVNVRRDARGACALRAEKPMDTILRLSQITKSFPGVKALSGIDLQIARGEIHALLGENGAGKSTLMKILCGIHQPEAGTIEIDGVERHFANYHDAVAAGVGIVFQEFSLIPHLDAVDNLFLGRELRGRWGVRDRARMRRTAAGIFARLGVSIDLDAPIRTLSVAQQQFVEIGKALSLDARILILDEPTATLTPAEAEHLFAIMRELKRQGVAMIFISHHLDEIFAVCDRITVLRDGQYVATTEVAHTDVEQLVRMMVGRRIESSFPPKPARRADAPAVLEVDALQLERGGPVNRFALHAGEILGFAGLVGSGRTETALAVIGATRAYRKTVRVHGAPAKLADPADALRAGIGILPESRKTEGLVTSFSIRDNISLNNLGKYRSLRWLIDRRGEARTTEDVMRRVGVKAPSIHAEVATLSGGNQQKVVIARWLNHHATVLIFDEPTRGIDVGAKAEIYGLMRELTARGYAIIMISSELPEIVGMCDRVAVFRQGRIEATLEGDEIDPDTVMTYATAGTRGATHEPA